MSALLMLSGCAKLDIALTLKPDNTVDGSVVIAVARELAQLSGDPDQLTDDADLPPGATQEPYEDDRFVGSRVTFINEPIEEFSEDDFQITKVDDQFEVQGVIDWTEMAGTNAEARLSITFPGAVTEHNGRLDGRTVIWEPAPGDFLEFRATGGAEGGSSLFTILAVLIALLLLAGLGFVVFQTLSPGNDRSGE